MQEHFLYIFPAAFPALVLAHFVALLSPGPDFFLVLGHSARYRLRGSALICLGIAIGNAVYIALAIAGWSGIKESPALYRAMELAGAAYLIWMAVKLWQAARTPFQLSSREPAPGGVAAHLTPLAQLAAGLGSALLNPKNAVFYLTLMTVIIGPRATLPQQAAAGIWMASLVLAWDLLVAGVVSHPSVQGRLEARIPFIERTASVILTAMALLLLASIFKELLLPA